MLDLGSQAIIIGFRNHCPKMGEAIPSITNTRLFSKSELGLCGRRRSRPIPLPFVGLQDFKMTA